VEVETLKKSKETISRDAIVDFQNQMSKMEGAIIGDSAYCPLEHTFSDGIYVRQITIPAGCLVVGKIHKHEHPNFLLTGSARIATEDGYEELKAPCSMISKAGTKRVLYTITECVWTTIHLNPNNTIDQEELDARNVVETYEEYDQYLLEKEELLITNTED
jgi:hypothetical protein